MQKHASWFFFNTKWHHDDFHDSYTEEAGVIKGRKHSKTLIQYAQKETGEQKQAGSERQNRQNMKQAIKDN